MKHPVEMPLWSIILTIVIVIGSVIFAVEAVNWDRLYVYPNCGTVVQVSKARNEITIEDYYGNLWTWGEAEGWTVGNHVSMTMHDNKTPTNNKEDIILKVRWEGHLRH